MNVRIAEGNKPFHRNMVCVYCHDDISDAAVVCAGCGVACHSDCKKGECPTIACRGSRDKPRLTSLGEEYRQLERIDRRRTLIYFPIMMLLVMVTAAAIICHRMGVEDLGIAWPMIGSVSIPAIVVLFAARVLMSIQYEAKLEQLCQTMVEHEMILQAEIARLRSGQPDK